MEKNFKSITNEYDCFDLSDFQKGDNVIVQNPKTRERVRGILVSTSKRPAMVTIRDADGVEHTARLNHVVFLQAPERGWLHK